MTVLQLISSQGFYSAESMLCSLTRALANLECQPIIGAFRDERNPHVGVTEAVVGGSQLRIETILSRGRWDFRAVTRLRTILTSARVDVIHTHGSKADLLGYLASQRLDVVRVSTCHRAPNPKQPTYPRLGRSTLRRFDEVTAPSPQVGGMLEKSGIPKDRLSVIRNGVDVATFRNAAPTLRRELGLGNRPIIGFVARMVPYKGGAELIQSARSVLAVKPDAHFVFVGDGHLRENWQALAAQLGIADRVVFTGVRRDMPGVYASFDLLALPSLKATMPMALMEAMAASRPVIATRVGSVSELVMDQQTGVLCRPGDVIALSRAILDLLDDPERARRMGENGCERAAAEFSADAMAKRYFGVYERAMARRASALARRTAAHAG